MSHRGFSESSQENFERVSGTPAPGIADDSGAYTIEWLLLHCLGFGACWGWVHAAFFSSVLLGDAGEALSLNAWLANVLANGCAMIAIGCLSSRRTPLIENRAFAIVFVLLTAIGTAGLSFGSLFSERLVYAGAVLSGIGTAGLLLLWAEAYRSISPTIAKKYTIPGAMAVGVLYYLLISMLPRFVALVLMVLLPIASAALLQRTGAEASARKAERGGGAPDDRKTKASPRSIPLRFVAFTAVYCLAPGFIRGHTTALPFVSTSGIGEAMFSGVAVVMIAIAVASIVLFRKTRIDLAYKLIVPLMAAGLLLLPFLAPGQEAVAAIAIMSGYILFEMYVWASLTDAASNSGAPSALIFGVGKSGMNIGLLAGTFLGFNFGSSSTMLLVGVSVVLVYLFIVMENVAAPSSGVALLLTLSKDASPKVRAAREKVTIAEAAQMDLAEVFSAMVKERCSAVSIAFGLSAREAEVLELLAKGQSLQVIADTLCVAYSTVKTHTDRIYSKTGVHSRQELISLVEKTGDSIQAATRSL